MNTTHTKVTTFENLDKAISFVNANYAIKAFNPDALIKNLTEKSIAKAADGTLLIVDELGLLDIKETVEKCVCLRNGETIAVSPLELDILTTHDLVGYLHGAGIVKSDVDDIDVLAKVDAVKSYMKFLDFQKISLDDFNSTYETSIQSYWGMGEVGSHFERIDLDYLASSYDLHEVVSDVMEQRTADEVVSVTCYEIQLLSYSIYIVLN